MYGWLWAGGEDDWFAGHECRSEGDSLLRVPGPVGLALGGTMGQGDATTSRRSRPTPRCGASGLGGTDPRRAGLSWRSDLATYPLRDLGPVTHFHASLHLQRSLGSRLRGSPQQSHVFPTPSRAAPATVTRATSDATRATSERAYGGREGAGSPPRAAAAPGTGGAKAAPAPASGTYV